MDSKEKEKVTAVAIAEKLNMARSTVVNVLNPRHASRYSKKTRDKVLKEAASMGYQIELLSRTIKQPLHHVGFSGSGVANFEEPFMREILRGIQKAADKNGYLVMASEAADSLNNSVQEIERKADAKTKKLIDLVTSRILDGLLIDKSRFGNRQIALLEEAEVPFVLVNGRVPYEKLDVHRKACWVSIDHFHGGCVATDYLLRCGHRRIAVITLPISKYPVQYAPNMYCYPKEGFVHSIEKAGLDVCPEFALEGSVSDREKLFANLDTLMSLSNRPTAIFVADDYLAVLTMTYLANKGFRLPEDVSIVGYGNMPVCSAVVPKLTTVHVPWAKMGQAGFEMLVGLLQKTKEISVERSIHVTILEPALVEGGSAVTIR